MNKELLHKAAKIINDHPLLINMVSKRVKQLQQGRIPLIKLQSNSTPKFDIALLEIIEGKIFAEGNIPKNMTLTEDQIKKAKVEKDAIISESKSSSSNVSDFDTLLDTKNIT